MKVRMAETIQVYLCEDCASVHIGMFRKGELFAEAIPFDANALARELLAAIAESEARQSDGTGGRTH